MSDEGIRVHFDGRAYPLDEFTLGELEWLEEYLGSPLNDAELTTMRAAVGVVYLIKRRDDAEFTLEQARETPLAKLDSPEPEAEKPGPTRRAKPKAT